METEKIISYPKAIRGDKIACIVWDKLRGIDGLTLTTLRKEVLETLLQQVSKYKDITEVIDNLLTSGLLKKSTKTTTINILSANPKGTNYITGEKYEN